ncbi:ig-like domain-containing protein [Trichonephila clavata]|uniref:Ig-like domain-containing protein n=1 Tax=Trichonephila clavata TaxID=2740835 RepID=A0A8X6II65_TRICU|nr:ig-like domain-containing protein [Trichonephila clavata]
MRMHALLVPALRLAKLDVSSAVIRGEPAWLNCSYTLEGDELYSVKWYKNNVEFYRFLPTDRPPGQKYDLQGVYVDLDQSVEGYVYLKRTDLNTEGVYRCEVSAEAPSFQTVREEKEVRVYGKSL